MCATAVGDPRKCMANARPRRRVGLSTCAYSREENEEVVAELLAAHPDALLVRERRRFPHRDGVPGGYFAVLEKVSSERVDAQSVVDARRGRSKAR